jgi:tRNA (guanosine-2'-O-)-methyltransferase
MAVPRNAHYRSALNRGDTLVRRPCIHWIGTPKAWLANQRTAGARILGVELAEDATRLADLEAARQRTVIVLGHERSGIPDEAWDLLDEVVEIPMIGVGSSLNVAVAGSLVTYKLAGLS